MLPGTLDTNGIGREDEKELKKAIEKLEKDFDILNKSKIYRGRGESKYNNIYLDVENK